MPLGQLLQQSPKHARIAERTMPLLAVQIKALDDRVERMRRSVRVQIAAEPHRAQCLRSVRKPGAAELRPQKSVVEARVMRDEDRTFEAVEQRMRYIGERRRRSHHFVRDARQPLNLRRDRYAGVDQRGPFVDPHGTAIEIDSHHADLGHTLAPGARSGRLDIDEGKTGSERRKHGVGPDYRLSETGILMKRRPE